MSVHCAMAAASLKPIGITLVIDLGLSSAE
jgi:hypothetical protein